MNKYHRRASPVTQTSWILFVSMNNELFFCYCNVGQEENTDTFLKNTWLNMTWDWGYRSVGQGPEKKSNQDNTAVSTGQTLSSKLNQSSEQHYIKRWADKIEQPPKHSLQIACRPSRFPALPGASLPVWTVKLINMGAGRRRTAFHGALRHFCLRCVPGVRGWWFDLTALVNIACITSW